MKVMRFYELSPKVNSKLHYLTNGLIWTGAGFNLMYLATNWFSESDRWQGILGGLITFSLGILISKTRFKKIVVKFLTHIDNLPQRSWFFSFQAFRHYVLIILMMVMGLSLRNFSGIDLFYLAIIYMIMGTTLFLSSYYFYTQFLSSNFL